MNWLKNYWFGILTGGIIFIFLVMFILILLAPRTDLRERGFIPCTKMMAETMLDCEEKVSCLMGAIVRNSWCQARVIGHGAAAWLRGEQSYPWSNYIFVPELPAGEEFDDKVRAEYLKHNPAAAEEMPRLIELHEALENEQQQSDGIDPGQQPE